MPSTSPSRLPQALDVSHMGQLHVEGPAAVAFLQSMLSERRRPARRRRGPVHAPDERAGGIADDLIVYRGMAHGHYLLVVNAGNRETAYSWLKEREIHGTEVRDASDEYALVRGGRPPRVARARRGTGVHACDGRGHGVDVMVRRTGRDVRSREYPLPLGGRARAVGRGSRPGSRALRARRARHPAPEVCYPLHGNDITTETTRLAGLGWTCALDTEFTGAGPFVESRRRGPSAGSWRS